MRVQSIVKIFILKSSFIIFLLFQLTGHSYGIENFNGANWMETLYSGKPETRLRDIIIPGTHDSGTFGMTRSSPVAPGRSKWFGLAKTVVYSWGITQYLDTYWQLRGGNRYIDFRVKWDEKRKYFVTVHGLSAATVKTMLEQIKRFVSENPKEVIFLDFLALPGAEYDLKLAELVREYLGDNILPSSIGVQGLTFQKAWEEGKSIIPLIRAGKVRKKYPEFWGPESLTTPWPNTTDKVELLGKLTKGLDEATSNKFYVSQVLFTPKDNDIIKGVFKRNGLFDMTFKARHFYGEFIPKWRSQGKRVNIVISDFFEYTNAVTASLYENLRDLKRLDTLDHFYDSSKTTKKGHVLGNWDNFFRSPDAVFTRKRGITRRSKTYFFFGDEYVRYDTKNWYISDGHPKLIKGNWDLPWENGIDAAVGLGRKRAYFFKGDEVIKYHLRKEMTEKGYPRKIWEEFSGLKGVEKIDAAYREGKRKLVFVVGREKYHIREKKRNLERKSGLDPNEGSDLGQVSSALRIKNRMIYFYRGQY